MALGGGSGFFEILFFLLIFAAILFLAYITTKIVAKKSGIRVKSKYMEVVDKLDFGTDKQLFILRVGDEHFLISKASRNLDMLSKINIEINEIADEAGLEAGKLDFKSLLEKHLNFGVLKQNSKDGIFRKNVGKIRSLSEVKYPSGDGEGDNTDQ